MASETSKDTTTPSLGERFRFGEVQAFTTPTVPWFSAFLLAPLAIITVYSFLTYESSSAVWELSLTA